LDRQMKEREIEHAKVILSVLSGETGTPRVKKVFEALQHGTANTTDVSGTWGLW